MQLASLDIKSSENLPKLNKQVGYLNAILNELETKDLDNDLVELINERIVYLNNLEKEDKALMKEVQKVRVSILKEVQKKAKIVAKGYYRNLWMVLGMSAFGLPMGLVFSMAINNYGFIGIGLPIGMAVGMAVGAGMDEKARKEGRQLTVSLVM